jgi:hypothetical protein
LAADPVDKVIERSKLAWAEKELWRSVFQDAYKYAMPGRNLYLETTQGQLKSEDVYDSTLVSTTTRFANMLQSDMTPVGQTWANLVPGAIWKVGKHPDEVRKAQSLLDSVRDGCFAILHASNFDTSINEFYLDLAISTGCMLVNPSDTASILDFCAVPLYQVALERSPYGRYNVYRNYGVKARDVEETWRNLGFKAPPGFEKFVSEKPNAPVQCLEATYYTRPKWQHDVILKNVWGGAGDGEFVRVVDRQYKYSPWIITPWSRLAGESMGRGPVMAALPDARVLNKTKELTLKNAGLAIAPPLTAIDDGVINMSTVKLVPHALIPVGRNDGALGPTLKPLVLGENFDVANMVISDHQNIIRRTMMDDWLPEPSGSVRSATEFMARARDRSRNVGSPFARILSDCIRPVFQLCIHQLEESGQMDIIRRAHGFETGDLVIDGAVVDVQVVSPLFQASNLDDLDSLSAGLQLSSAAGQEAMMLALKVEDIPGYVFDKLGLPASLVRTEEEREMVKQQMAALATGQQQGA